MSENIRLEINGIRYENFVSISVRRSMESLCNNFSFVATIDDSLNQYPLKVGDKCVIYVNDIKVITGYIFTLNISYSASTHTIAVSGRDITADILDSSLVDGIELRAPITLPQAINRILSKNEITGIKVIDNANVKAFSGSELVSGEVGQNLWDLIDTYCKKRQVFANTNEDGNIVLTRANDQEFIPGSFIYNENEFSGTQNNVLDADVNFDDTARFNTYILKGQGNPSSLELSDNNFSFEEITDLTGQSKDNNIRTGRITVSNSENADSAEELRQKAIWQNNLKRARAFSYNVTLVGFYADIDKTDIWRPNILVNVRDDFCDLNTGLLLTTVVFTSSVDGSNLSSLQFRNRDAFTLQAKISAIESRTTSKGDNFIA